MLARLSSPWLFWLWVGWILFSQTAVAGTLADSFFALFFEPDPGPVDWKHFLAQKAYHVLLFAVLGVLVGNRCPTVANRATRARQHAVAWCIGLGVFAECLQFLSANRHPSAWDALLNVGSALLAYGLTARAAAPGSRPESSAPLPR